MSGSESGKLYFPSLRACVSSSSLRIGSTSKKCIPGTPRCDRCKALGIQDCGYTTVKKRGIGNTLRMREACIPCRLKKNKCDAKQPCTTCVKKDRIATCTYEGFRFTSNGLLVASPDSSESRSSRSLHVDLPKRSSMPPEQLERGRSLLVLDKVVPVPLSDAPAGEKPPAASVCPARSTPSPFTVLPSIHFQTIPRPFRTPLSVIPPECMQLSGVAENDLDLSIRLNALCRLNKLGLYFTKERQDAVLRGDTSNSVVHRHFVDGTQVMGMHFCGPGESPARVRLQAKYLQIAWESLIQLNGTNREREKVQALVLVAHGFVILRLSTSAQLYFLKACKIIEKAKLRFLPEHEPPAEFSEQVREEASVLSQVIYLENLLYLTLGGSAPAKTARIEREFRFDLLRVYPCLLEICPLTMRTQSILLVRDAVHAMGTVGRKADPNVANLGCG
ncbi:hypothetical protein BJ322DRAFT_370638 [Thelephora terrestris]|uniref:Zn(2)-C6 fungal-type domain-containing protein n=1 Tax=Thelephora terrestris TaxID=56493 RepID=A0A9P6L2A3_9AGAM|nr:hypothetical protein BJ322DRAFT_370638 [Thelephora terrestris]